MTATTSYTARLRHCTKPQQRRVPSGLLGLALAACLVATPSGSGQAQTRGNAQARTHGKAQPPPAVHKSHAKSYICPIDGGRTSPVGHDGKASLRRYSDLEQPTRAYTNQVLACPKCGYANWKGSFEQQPSGTVVHYVRSRFKRSARRAASEPVVAYQHHLNLLHLRSAPIKEQIGAALFYTYVLKRKRPYGGIDPKLERKLVAARTRTLKLLRRAMKNDPPRRQRALLEWRYLIGELQRLTGFPKAAHGPLEEVCEKKRKAGHTTGRLACEMAHRAANGETWEDYRDGVFDVRGIEIAERRAKDEIVKRKVAEIARKKAEAAVEDTRKKTAAAKAKSGAAPPSPKGVPQVPSHDAKHLAPNQGDDPLAPSPPPPAK
jgi:hypothetical protein